MAKKKVAAKKPTIPERLFGAVNLAAMFGFLGGLEKPEEGAKEAVRRIRPLSPAAASRRLGAMCDPWARKQRRRKLARRAAFRRWGRYRPWLTRPGRTAPC